MARLLNLRVAEEKWASPHWSFFVWTKPAKIYRCKRAPEIRFAQYRFSTGVPLYLGLGLAWLILMGLCMKQAEAQAQVVNRQESPLVKAPDTIVIPVPGSCKQYAALANQSGNGFAGKTTVDLIPNSLPRVIPLSLPKLLAGGFFCGCNSTLYKTYDECDREGACRPVIKCFASLCIPQRRSQICVDGTATGGFRVNVRITVHQWSVPGADAGACAAEVGQFNANVIDHEKGHVERFVDAVDDWNRRHNNDKIKAEGCGSDAATAQEDADRQIAEEIKAQQRALTIILNAAGEPPGGQPMNCTPCPD